MAAIERVIGIDLGTTNSCVAIIESGVPIVIPGTQGQTLVPSMMAVTEQGKRLVGQLAKRQAVLNAEHTVYATKRLIGRKFSSQAVKQTMEMVPYRIVPGPNDDARVVLRNQTLSTIEIAATVLSEMRRIAEQYLHESVRKAVLTVPAYFNDAQRQATKEAGRMAGLEVLRILNEPTAAGLAYGIGQGATRTQRVAVYDLGGGTFDISLLDLRGGVFEVLATAGDTFLGGEDFDRRILDWLIFGFAKDHKIDLRPDRTALQRLRDAVERAKCELSTQDEVAIEVPFIISTGTSEPLHLRRTLTRAKLEELTEDLIDRTIQICRNTLNEAGIDTHEIDTLILVGGMTRMPRVQATVQEFFARSPCAGIHPEEVVAIGAALQGAALSEDGPPIALLDVTPRGLGILTAGPQCYPLIGPSTRIPCERSHVFTTTRDYQTVVRILVFEGEAEQVEDNELLGEFVLDALRPAAKGEVEVEVRFSMSADGLLSVFAKDLETGRQRSVMVTSGSVVPKEDAQQMMAHANTYALELRQDDEYYRAQQRTERLIGEINSLLPRAEAVVGGSDMGLDAVRRARAAVERAKIAIIRGEPVGLLDTQEVLQRTVTMLKGVTGMLRLG